MKFNWLFFGPIRKLIYFKLFLDILSHKSDFVCEIKQNQNKFWIYNNFGNVLLG